jgi:hypothetical protein
MTSDKIQQLGNDLAQLAASLSEIAEELQSVDNSEHGSGEESDAPESQVEVSDLQQPKQPTLEEVRGILADKASNGHREAVQALIHKRGVKKLSEIDPAVYQSLIEEVSALS